MSSYLIAAASVYETLHQFVIAYKLHPILVNFTAALVPVSVGSDVLGWVFRKQSLRDTGWWTPVLPRSSPRSPPLPAGCSGRKWTSESPA